MKEIQNDREPKEKLLLYEKEFNSFDVLVGETVEKCVQSIRVQYSRGKNDDNAIQTVSDQKIEIDCLKHDKSFFVVLNKM